MRYKIPSQLLAHFGEEALKSKVNDGHVETLAIGLGYLEDDCYHVVELVFPNQSASATHVEDKGKIYFVFCLAKMLISDCI